MYIRTQQRSAPSKGTNPIVEERDNSINAGNHERYSGLKAFCTFWFIGVPLTAVLCGLILLTIKLLLLGGWLSLVGGLILVVWVARKSNSYKEAAKVPKK